MCFAPQRRALFQHANLHKWREHVVFCTFWLGNVLGATTACTFSTCEPPKVARTCGALYILTWKCAWHHNGVHFFNIRTSKSGDLEMCFAPQRRALFQHPNLQKWREHAVFCIFWLGNVLRATTACTFSTSQLPKVVRTWCVLYILTWKCASRHNGVTFSTSQLPKVVRRWGVLYLFTFRNVLRATTACNFSSLIWPAGSAPAALASLLFLEKQSVSRLSYPFAHLHLLSSTLLSSNLSLLFASSLLCFSSVHIVGSLTSKLPSMIVIDYAWIIHGLWLCIYYDLLQGLVLWVLPGHRLEVQQ